MSPDEATRQKLNELKRLKKCWSNQPELRNVRLNYFADCPVVLGHRLRVGMDVKLFVDAANICVDRMRTDFKTVRYLFFRMPVRKKIQHLPFAFG